MVKRTKESAVEYEIRDDRDPDEFPRRRRGPRKYPVDRLEPGQHLVIPVTPPQTRASLSSSVIAAIGRHRATCPHKQFTTRYDATNKALRVFRLDDLND